MQGTGVVGKQRSQLLDKHVSALRQIRRAKSGLVRCRRKKKDLHHLPDSGRMTPQRIHMFHTMNLRPFVCFMLVDAMSFAAPSAFGNENIAVSAVSQDSSPIAGPEEKASCQSLPNNKGEIVFISFDASVKAHTLLLRKNDNTIIKLFTYGAGTVAVTPPPTEEILWLNDNCFACVSSGRKKSFYAIYDIAREEPGNTQHSTIIYQLAEGCFCFRVSWRTEEGTLKATRYDKTISLICL